MRIEGGKAVGGAGSSGGKGVDAAGSVIAAESAHCEVLDWEGACWATAVTAAGASAERVPPSEGTAKTNRKWCRLQETNLRGRDGDRRW